MSDDEYDNLFDDLTTISGAEWDTILPAQPEATETHAPPIAPVEPRELPSPASESDFGDDFDGLDSSFFAAVDAIEHAAVNPTAARSSRGERWWLSGS